MSEEKMLITSEAFHVWLNQVADKGLCTCVYVDTIEFEVARLTAELAKAREGVELEALITEREGMIAENLQRQYLGNAMAYTEDNFLILADKIRRLKEAADVNSK